MKKLLSLTLTLVLCLSLCACGSKKENITPGDNGNSTTTQTDNNTMQSDNNTMQSDNNTPQSAYVGEWKANVLVGNSGDGREYDVAIIQLNNDGTGSYKDKALTWELSADGTAINFVTTADNITGNFKIQITDGKTTLNFYQDTYYRAAEFEENNG